jgi:hypothetical protein
MYQQKKIKKKKNLFSKYIALIGFLEKEKSN